VIILLTNPGRKIHSLLISPKLMIFSHSFQFFSDFGCFAGSGISLVYLSAFGVLKHDFDELPVFVRYSSCFKRWFLA